MISTDIFLEIGAQHKICEDYIVHGDDPVPYIILADGCSTADDTEMGARILCHLAKQYIRYQRGTSLNLDYHKTGQSQPLESRFSKAAPSSSGAASLLNPRLLFTPETDQLQTVIIEFLGECCIVRERIWRRHGPSRPPVVRERVVPTQAEPDSQPDGNGQAYLDEGTAHLPFGCGQYHPLRSESRGCRQRQADYCGISPSSLAATNTMLSFIRSFGRSATS